MTQQDMTTDDAGGSMDDDNSDGDNSDGGTDSKKFTNTLPW